MIGAQEPPMTERGAWIGLVVGAFGLAMTVAPLTATAMGAAPAQHSGVASAVNNVVARAGGLLAVAVACPAPL